MLPYIQSLYFVIKPIIVFDLGKIFSLSKLNIIRITARLFYLYGYLWHGYEIIGINNIPETGPAIIIFYHGVVDIDYFCFYAKYFLIRNKLIYTLGDKIFDRVAGIIKIIL